MRLSWWHIVIIILVVLLLFGSKRLPDLARSLGRSMRIIKAETRGLMEDDVAAKAEPKTGRQPLTSDDEASPIVDPVTRKTDK
ncbi:MAG TPA: Sec-independent protein translocase subunit TatA [Micromonosporaceae bacterium]|jgi:sec-independent protein translocase protein TatA